MTKAEIDAFMEKMKGWIEIADGKWKRVTEATADDWLANAALKEKRAREREGS